MTPRPIIPIVIPYYRAPDALKRCLAAIKEQEFIESEVYIRDNSEDNVLFTRAVNEGLRKFLWNSDIKYVLVLNQDAYLRKQCIDRLVKVMEDFPRAGIVIPVSVNAENQINSFAALQAFPWGVSRGGMAEDIPAEPYGTYWANGACMLIRVGMIHEIGLLDENMRFICSDADYSFAARSRGWDVMVAPTAFIEHSLSSSGNAANPMLHQVKLCDQLYFGQKWLSGDLYRKLAYEGQSLSSDVIAKEIGDSQNNLAEIRRHLDLLQAQSKLGN